MRDVSLDRFFQSPSLHYFIFHFHFSRAIMCYLVNKYGEDAGKEKLYPRDAELRANVDRMLYVDIGSLYKNIVDYFVSVCNAMHA